MRVDELEDVWPLLARRRIFQFANATQTASDALIKLLLKKMQEEKPNDAVSLFLRSAVDERALRESWRVAITTLKAIGAYYSWGSKPKRDRLNAAAKQPRLVSAFQAAAVGAEDVPVDYLAVLVIDGSDASIDALIPHFDAAGKDPTRLDELSMLSTFAKDTAALNQLIARSKEQLEARKTSGPSLQLAKELGIAGKGRFRVHVRGAGPPDDETSFEIFLDSESPGDFRVWTFLKGRRTTFTARELQFDDLDAGRCELRDLPQWLAARQTSLGTRWRQNAITADYLKGKRLQIFLDWLLGPSRVG